MTSYGYLLPSGLYVVVYPEKFTFLWCDHHEGTIAVDLFDSNGTFFDGIVACPKCLPAAITTLERIAA